MKEITFLKQNAPKWEKYEKLVENKASLKPAELTDMFIELTDDLSYAATNYGETKTLAYVNSLASRIHQLVYKNKKEPGNRLARFYAFELPLMFGKYHRQLLYSFIVTVVAALLGIISQHFDDSFSRLILGDNYVDDTIERIKNGNPLGIYGEHNSFFSFVYITINNIRVSFMAFVLGLLTSFGTSLLLAFNGIMLGCFLTMLFQYGAGMEAMKVVWIHGTIEISSIIIAGCAGFVLGTSFIFPGTYTRLEAMIRAGKDGLKIVIGLIPFFITAGFLEGFVTRYTKMPLWLSLCVIGISFLCMIQYFVVFPYLLRKKYGIKGNSSSVPSSSNSKL